MDDTIVSLCRSPLLCSTHARRNFSFFENMCSHQHTMIIIIINDFYSPEIIFSKMKLGPVWGDTLRTLRASRNTSNDRCSHTYTSRSQFDCVPCIRCWPSVRSCRPQNCILCVHMFAYVPPAMRFPHRHFFAFRTIFLSLAARATIAK